MDETQEASRGASRASVEARSYELDPYGHVNNAVYINWFEHGRLVWLRERDLTYMSIPERYSVRVVVVSMQVDYKSEISLGDRLVVVSQVARLGRSSFQFAQRLEFEDGRLAAEAVVTMVCTLDGRSEPIPPELRARLV